MSFVSLNTCLYIELTCRLSFFTKRLTLRDTGNWVFTSYCFEEKKKFEINCLQALYLIFKYVFLFKTHFCEILLSAKYSTSHLVLLILMFFSFFLLCEKAWGKKNLNFGTDSGSGQNYFLRRHAECDSFVKIPRYDSPNPRMRTPRIENPPLVDIFFLSGRFLRKQFEINDL